MGANLWRIMKYVNCQIPKQVLFYFYIFLFPRFTRVELLV